MTYRITVLALLGGLICGQALGETTTVVSHQTQIDRSRRDAACTNIQDPELPVVTCSSDELEVAYFEREGGFSNTRSVLEFWLSDSPLPGAPEVATLPSGPLELVSATLTLTSRTFEALPEADYGDIVYLNDVRRPTGDPRTDYGEFFGIDDGVLITDVIGVPDSGAEVSFDVTAAVAAAIEAGDSWVAVGMVENRQLIDEDADFYDESDRNGRWPTLTVVTRTPSLSFSVDGMDTLAGVCQNLTFPQTVVIPDPEPRISTTLACAQQDPFDTVAGDELRLIAVGRNFGPELAGSVNLVDATAAVCTNSATGQRVTVPIGPEGAWDCAAGGLSATNGDRLTVVLLGVAQ